METIIYLLKVHLIFQGCISGLLTCFFIMVALKYKDLI